MDSVQGLRGTRTLVRRITIERRLRREIAALRAQPGSIGVRRRTPLLEAFSAENRAPLSQLERNRRFLPALGACRGGHHTRRALARYLPSLRFTRLAAFWLVSEALLRIKLLLACGENEVIATLGALERLVPVLHRIPPRPF